ncbi:MAG: hypothetical protein KZQ66_21285 [Candidatus Thiodiazotropha sp. (ex Lucinoma aequizonata)]|nr:hypothetical protein [Candidatus Thiodiazotropha sp. (ex Lucinoma aequizonata)]MCU7895082.1 hypothetical protein [Candidatus Thiodiazotropha sp. (ex Lucinoma aequizonata)]MCU7904196.1 hypothetical protein [Candidatus Thiodiazotropha sp. (ex Lucinoma aequizonata)]MCU7912159.1 hypothetical protein [Candidatus Thiodiazotropha sp. (ex Lucinoma aequizonata)]
MTGVMKKLFGGGGSTYTPPTPPKIDYDSIDNAAAAERKRQRAAKGRASTILTSGSGVTGSANLGTTVLLGK